MEPPPDDQDRRGFLQRIRVRLRRVKDSLRHALWFRPQVQRPETSPKTSLISRVLCRSHPDTPPTSPQLPLVGLEQDEPIIKPTLPQTDTLPVKSQEDPKDAAWKELTDSLRTLEGLSELFPPLESAIGAFIGCLEVVKAAASAREDCNKLVGEFQAIVESVIPHAGELESEPRGGSIANISQCIRDQAAGIKRQEGRGTMGRLPNETPYQEDVIKCYRQAERQFRKLQCDLNMRTKNATKKILETTLLRGMLPVDDAKYNSGYSMTIRRRGCTAETRVGVHQALHNWTTNPDSNKIHWMSGMAGTGKTTIAYSYCEWLKSTNRLGASFFCSRTSSICRSLNRIVPTIAYQLAHFSPAFRPMLCAALNDEPDTAMLNVKQQFEKLIYRPMLDSRIAIPDVVVVVIDALDECDDSYSVRLFLEALLKFTDPLPLKFFVASRPEHFILDPMVSLGGASRELLHLHDIEQSIVEQDIKKYLTEALSSMYPPPSLEQIELLAKRSGNLFIYAATIVRYIYPEDIHVDSAQRLRLVLEATGSTKRTAHNMYEDLDRLYTTVLSSVSHSRLDDDEKGHLQRVLWTVVCGKEPIAVATIASLASLDERQVWGALQSLRSVVYVRESVAQVSSVTASFSEYMLHESRSGEFHCDESQSNEVMVHRCFDIMKSGLRFNICNLNSSYLTNGQVPDLDTRAPQCISSTLSYACRHWGSHLVLAPPSENTRDMIVDFLSNRLLFWMEVLSLSRCIGIGAPMMQQVQTWLQLADAPDEIQKRMSDARNFVTWFAANPCCHSTPHIYISALPLCAKSNWVYQHYSQRMRGLANIAINQRDEAVLAIWSVESEVNAIAISPGGGRIAAGVDDGSILFYDIHTGAIIVEPFKGHTGFVMSVAFSPDGTLIASGSYDQTVIVWDVHTGRITSGPLRGHTGKVYSVAFSPDGKQVVSGSEDNTAIVWDVYSGSILIGPLKGHSDAIYSVKFSPDGQFIASGSVDRTIRLWDACTGAPVTEPLTGHDGPVLLVAFSPDAQHICSGSADKTARIWDISSRSICIPPFQGHIGAVRSVAFSPDGTQLATAGDEADRKVIVWDSRSGSIHAGPFYGHTSSINSVAFTPDSTRIVTGSSDRSIRIWDACPKENAVPALDSHEASIGPVAFSSDCIRFTSNSSSGVLRVWDLHTGAVVSPPFEAQGQPQTIHSVSFSLDGLHIAASTSDFIIRIWNVMTGLLAFSRQLIGHKGRVGCVVFSPDGAHICSGSDDATIIAWDIRTGTMNGLPYDGHVGSILSVTYSPDGSCIASGSTDATIRGTRQRGLSRVISHVTFLRC